MLKDLFKTLFLLSCVIIGCATIEWLKATSETLPVYTVNIIIVAFLVVAWVYVIKLMKSMEE